MRERFRAEFTREGFTTEAAYNVSSVFLFLSLFFFTSPYDADVDRGCRISGFRRRFVARKSAIRRFFLSRFLPLNIRDYKLFGYSLIVEKTTARARARAQGYRSRTGFFLVGKCTRVLYIQVNIKRDFFLGRRRRVSSDMSHSRRRESLRGKKVRGGMMGGTNTRQWRQ